MERMLYRHLRRAAQRIDGLIVERQPAVTFRKETSRFRHLLPPTLVEENVRWDEPLCANLRHAFDETQVSDAAAVDNAFAALRRGNDRIECLNADDWEPKPSAIQHDIGQIFRHKKHGFRGVIVEWYESCPAPKNWQETYGPFEKGFDQPFYRTLVDTKDRPHPFMALAAEENLLPLHNEDVPVSHPLMDETFAGFEEGRHIMHEEVALHFPED
jgi:hemimethylated DNA binding protein